jgi:hypothetical protein
MPFCLIVSNRIYYNQFFIFYLFSSDSISPLILISGYQFFNATYSCLRTQFVIPPRCQDTETKNLNYVPFRFSELFSARGCKERPPLYSGAIPKYTLSGSFASLRLRDSHPLYSVRFLAHGTFCVILIHKIA